MSAGDYLLISSTRPPVQTCGLMITTASQLISNYSLKRGSQHSSTICPLASDAWLVGSVLCGPRASLQNASPSLVKATLSISQKQLLSIPTMFKLWFLFWGHRYAERKLKHLRRMREGLVELTEIRAAMEEGVWLCDLICVNSFLLVNYLFTSVYIISMMVMYEH